MRRFLNILRRRRPGDCRTSPQNPPILFQGTSIVAAAQRIHLRSDRLTLIQDALEEIMELARELPLLDSSTLEDSQLAGTRAIIRELGDLSDTHSDTAGPGDMKERTMMQCTRLAAIISTLEAQPQLYVFLLY